MSFTVSFGSGGTNVSWGDDDYDDYDPKGFVEEPVPPAPQEEEVQTVSYQDPNDGIATPQEPQIRQEESRIENDNKEIKSEFVQGQITAAATGAAAAAKEPISTVIAGGTTVYHFKNMKEAYNDKQVAKERYEEKVQEEKAYLDKVKQDK